jgi:WD40 repeat protein/serine/threonine protein kinase
LVPDDRDGISRHVEGCAACQDALGRLSWTDDVQSGWHANRSPLGSADEESAVRRLKQKPPTPIVPPADAQPSDSGGETTDNKALASDFERPAVPGYVILGELGRGGMGVVYQARQVALQRTVALKMILRSIHAGPKERDRFRTEAEVIARLQHPNIVQIYDVGEIAGRPYFALEFVAGGSLTRYLDGTPQPIRPAALLIETLARAVQAAHDCGVVHRDLKPANILLQIAECRLQDEQSAIRNPQSAIPKITDFGLAKRIELPESERLRAPTVTGELLGTPNYMAPEQAMVPRQPVGPPADVYALGAILYELLTGKPPFRGETPLDTILQVLHDDPVSVARLQPSVPRDLETICLKCLEKEPRKRYVTARALAEDLHRFIEGEPIIARPRSALYQWSKFAQRNKGLVAALLALAFALTLGAVAAAVFAVRAKRERDTALRQAYYASVAAAGAALRDDDVPAAARHLEHAPQALRGWEWDHLRSRLDDSAAVIRAPPYGGQISVAASDQGIRLVTAATELKVFDVDGKEFFHIPRNGPGILHVECTRRGTRVFRSDDAGALVVLDETGQVRLHLDAPAGKRASVVAVSPDQSQFALNWGQDDPPYSFALYDLPTGRQQAICVGHTGYAFGLAYSPDGRKVASAAEDHTARVWDAATGKPLAVLTGHADKLLGIAFSPSGDKVVTASADGTVRQWDASTGKPTGIPYRGHHHEVHTAIYSPDGHWIASGDQGGAIRIWDADNQNDVALLHGHTGVVLQLAFGPDGRQLVSVSDDRTARLWAVGFSPTVLRGHTNYVYPVSYSPDGRWIATGSWDGTIRIWDAESGEASATLHQGGNVRALAFSRDASWLVAGGDDLQTWDVLTGQIRQKLEAPGKVVLAVAVSPDDQRIAAVDRYGVLNFTNAITGQQISLTETDPDHSWAEKRPLAFSDDGRWFATASSNLKSNHIDLYDAKAPPGPCPRLVGHTDMIQSLAFSPDGRRLVSAGKDRSVRIWDTATAAQLMVLGGHTDEVFAAVFHPDGRRVASAGRDGAILVWDLATAAEVARLQGHTNYVFSLAFSPDGTSLVSGSGDGTARLWDTMPLAHRLAARREADSCHTEAEQLVERLLREKKQPDEVARVIWADPSLTDPLRREAQRAIWRRLVKQR